MMKIKARLHQERGRLGRRILSIFCSASTIRSISVSPCMLTTTIPRRAPEQGPPVTREQLFRWSDVHLLGICTGDSLATGNSTNKDRQLPHLSNPSAMLHLPNDATARDPIVPAQARNISESTPSSSRKMWTFWSGACFVIVLLAAFGQPLLGLANYAAHSSLHSYILLIPFISGYLLYLRRDQLPKERVADLPFGIVLLACGLGVFLFTHWLAFAGRAPADNYYFVLLTTSFICCFAAGGFFFFGRPWMRAAAFPLAYLIFMVPMPDAMADVLETASKYASAEVANVLFHLSGTPILRAGLVFQLPNI